jgi:Tol biopolymer transport system component
MRRSLGAIVIAAVSVALCAQPAFATYRGKNGLIAIGIDRGKGTQIYTVRPDGADLTQLTHIAGHPQDPDWSPDGTKIAFTFTVGGGPPCRIGIMNADGSGFVDITPKPFVANGGCGYQPSFMPNGKRIVFIGSRCKDENACPWYLRSMSVRGHHQRRILRRWNDNIDLLVPNVSPDGRTIAFVVAGGRRHDERNAMYTVRMNGTHLTQVVPYSLDVAQAGADWSPNGKRIDGSDHVEHVPGPSNLFTVRPDGTGFRYVTHFRVLSPAVNVGAGSYSPDGRWIVFKHSFNDAGRYVMLKIHPDGSGLTRIRGFKFSFFTRDWGARAS